MTRDEALDAVQTIRFGEYDKVQAEYDALGDHIINSTPNAEVEELRTELERLRALVGKNEKVIQLMNRYKFWDCFHTEGAGVVVKCDYVEEDPEAGYKREGFRINSW